MKKKFKIQNLDCANCAAKMEDAIRKIDGVDEVSVSFLTQKLTIECKEEKLEEILAQASKCIQRVDPDAGLVI